MCKDLERSELRREPNALNPRGNNRYGVGLKSTITRPNCALKVLTHTLTCYMLKEIPFELGY